MANGKFNFGKAEKRQFGKLLKEIRTANGFVQDDLANYMGVTRASYSSMETGVYGPQIKTLGRIVEFYGSKGIALDLAYLIGLKKSNGAVKATEESVRANKLDEKLAHCNEVIKAQKVTIETLSKTNDQLNKMLDSKSGG